jgi:hypothetical protein
VHQVNVALCLVGMNGGDEAEHGLIQELSKGISSILGQKLEKGLHDESRAKNVRHMLRICTRFR